jgi:hypothetical protein
MRVTLSCYRAPWFSVVRLVLNEPSLYLTPMHRGRIGEAWWRRPVTGTPVTCSARDSEMKNQYKDDAGERNRCPQGQRAWLMRHPLQDAAP